MLILSIKLSPVPCLSGPIFPYSILVVLQNGYLCRWSFFHKLARNISAMFTASKWRDCDYISCGWLYQDHGIVVNHSTDCTRKPANAVCCAASDTIRVLFWGLLFYWYVFFLEWVWVFSDILWFVVFCIYFFYHLVLFTKTLRHVADFFHYSDRDSFRLQRSSQLRVLPKQ